MKLAEMYQICEKQKGKCETCQLNCIENWQDELLTWCLISLKKKYVKLYQEEIEKGNNVLAERIKSRYEELEQQYLAKNKEFV